MATGQVLPFSIASVVEDLLQQHGVHLRDIELASKKAEEECMFFVILFSGLCISIIDCFVLFFFFLLLFA